VVVDGTASPAMTAPIRRNPSVAPTAMSVRFRTSGLFLSRRQSGRDHEMVLSVGRSGSLDAPEPAGGLPKKSTHETDIEKKSEKNAMGIAKM
jgi:hypothetical protein